jgi:SNF2 family DNA or RNA helicase
MQICNHPLITYPPEGYEASMLKHWLEADERLITQCGKMHYVDRLLVKFFKTGHRVLLFSTMTKVLDIMERYLQWREVDGALPRRHADSPAC